MSGRPNRLDTAVTAASDALVDAAFSAAMFVNRRRYWPPLDRALADPGATQRRVLAEILAANATTTFGAEHGFAAITGPGSYRNRVPVQDYESLRAHIEEQERSGTPTLTTAPPVLYAQTSGTGGTPKYLPITAEGIRRVARTQRLFATSVHRRSSMFAGRIVGIGSPAIEGHLPGGSPFGSASGMVYEQMPRVVRRKYVLGPELLAVADHDLRYLLMAASCAAAEDVTGVATANPSTLLRLWSVIVDGWDEVITAVADGTLPGLESLPAAQAEPIADSFVADPDRARALDRLRSRHGDDLGYRHLWFRLGAITTWTGGSAGFALAALRPHLDPATKVAELGYSASEMRATVGIDPDTNQCVPLVTDNFFEFVPVERREAASGDLDPDDFVGLEELETGAQYYVYVTTYDGLYRYDMNDIVEVSGRHRATPTLAFVRKGRGVTNITGEKLTENQILAAVDAEQRQQGMALAFFVALADEAGARYHLYLEPAGSARAGSDFGAAVDRRLSATNIEYGAKRSSGRLGPIVARELEAGTGARYRSELVAGGQRDA
ncbi:MAG: GH3 auxin-responsive promoter family protein, partial [Actinomycetota bacterium]